MRLGSESECVYVFVFVRVCVGGTAESECINSTSRVQEQRVQHSTEDGVGRDRDRENRNPHHFFLYIIFPHKTEKTTRLPPHCPKQTPNKHRAVLFRRWKSSRGLAPPKGKCRIVAFSGTYTQITEPVPWIWLIQIMAWTGCPLRRFIQTRSCIIHVEMNLLPGPCEYPVRCS